MKTAVDLYRTSNTQQPSEERREWTGPCVVRVCLAAILMSAVYFFIAHSLPAPADSESGGHLFTGFVLFWILGGLFTVALLALSDRRS